MGTVKVRGAVSEVRNVYPGFCCCQELGMAEKAEPVFPLFITGIEGVGKGETKYECIVRAVRIVTGRAIALYYRAVFKLSVSPLSAFFMAGVAEVVQAVMEEILVF
jgi:hypothetical protein